ncbi:MAG: undecaprenyldiphospho-muramoylpentapeptide beta-N-acetylglucosaminyltransferase [Clostridia bacterium]|nr:undecaprenyldiphospho-muramoylpentapeptide beta-N-acetylglucosaminyltransferase [Clostridia bacterium]
MKKTIVITGGGTAGHIMPNIALLPEIKKHFDKIYYLGSKNSMEEKLIKDYKYINFVAIPTTKLIRTLTLKNLSIPFKLFWAIHKTKKILKQIKPNIIFCKGGFVSVPVAIAGKKLNLPIVSHESDLSLGLANKIILKRANVMCTSFEDTAKINKKCVCTGSPVRKQILSGRANVVITEFKGYNSALPTVLFFGGSLGAKNINELVFSSLEELSKKYNIIHIVGKDNSKKQNINNYYQLEFTSTIENLFALADVVVCRGGANSLFELLAIAKPMLIIPLSKAQSRGDQIENAKYFKNKGYAEMMLEEEMNTKLLLQNINKVLANRNKYISNMKSAKANNANKNIIDIILKNCR